MEFNKDAKLFVENEIQRIIMVCEMAGQISDGMWEATRPTNHWEVWCDAQVIVDEEKQGRNFFAPKDNYNFGSTTLLEIVGERLLFKVKAHLVLGLDADDMENYFIDGSDEYRIAQLYANGTNGYWDLVLKNRDLLGVNETTIKQIEDYPYSMKDLKKEITNLRKACKNYIPQ